MECLSQNGMTSSRRARRHSRAIPRNLPSMEGFFGTALFGSSPRVRRGPPRPKAEPRHHCADREREESDRADLSPVARAAGGNQEKKDRQAECGAERADDPQLAAVVALADLGGEVDRAVAPREELPLPRERLLARRRQRPH